MTHHDSAHRRFGRARSARTSLVLAVALTIGVTWLAFFAGLGSTSLFNNAEPLFAEASREMLATGDWVTPRVHDTPRFDKPPLMYWLTALAFAGAGLSEWAVRLPSALAAGAVVAAVFAALLAWAPATRDQRPWIAALGGCITALNLETVFWARVGVADMVLTACVSGTLLAFFLAYVRSSRRAWLLAFALAALGVMAKGPVGLVLPALVIAVFLGLTGTWRAVAATVPLVSGAAVFLAITLPWHAMVYAANGWRFVEEFFGYHNLYRYRHVVEGQSGPWYFYAVVIAVFLAPWSVFLPGALVRSRFWSRHAWQQASRAEQLGLLAAVWFLTVLGFFSLAATKLHNYVLPLVPAAAILIALGTTAMARAPASSRGWGVEGWTSVAAATGLGLLLWWGPERLAEARDTSFPAMPALLGALVPSGAAREALLETGRQMQRAGAHQWALIICLASACAKLVAILRKRPLALVATGGAAWIAFLVLVLGPVALAIDALERRPVRTLATAAGILQQPGEPIFFIGTTPRIVTFYSRGPVQSVPGLRDLLRACAGSASPSALVLTDTRAWNGLMPGALLLEAAGSYRLVRLLVRPATAGGSAGGGAPPVEAPAAGAAAGASIEAAHQDARPLVGARQPGPL